jgi:hypothetical protein
VQKIWFGKLSPVHPNTFNKPSSILLVILPERVSTFTSFLLTPGTLIVNTFSEETSGLNNKLMNIQGLGWVEMTSFNSIR